MKILIAENDPVRLRLPEAMLVKWRLIGGKRAEACSYHRDFSPHQPNPPMLQVAIATLAPREGERGE